MNIKVEISESLFMGIYVELTKELYPDKRPVYVIDSITAEYLESEMVDKKIDIDGKTAEFLLDHFNSEVEESIDAEFKKHNL